MQLLFKIYNSNYVFFLINQVMCKKKQVSGKKFRNDVILINMSAQLMQSIKINR